MASCFLTRGYLVIITLSVVGESIRLGVSNAGGLPKVALVLGLGAEAGVGVGVGVGEVGDVVAVEVVGGRECRGGGSCVGIL